MSVSAHALVCRCVDELCTTPSLRWFTCCVAGSASREEVGGI
jgi:hypothetical protein